MIGKIFSAFFEIEKIYKEQKRLISMRKPALNELAKGKVAISFKHRREATRYYDFVCYDELRKFYVLCLGNSMKIKTMLNSKIHEMRQYAELTRSLMYSLKISCAYMAAAGIYLLISTALMNVQMPTMSIVYCFVFAGVVGLIMQCAISMFWDYLINMCSKLIKIETKAYNLLSEWYLDKIDEIKMNA